MMFAKVLLVTDEEVKPQNHLEFWRVVLRNAVPGRDSQFAKGPTDVLDHSSRAWSYGSKLIVDGTIKHDEEDENASKKDRWQPNPTRLEKDLPKHPEIANQHQLAGWFLVHYNREKTRRARATFGRVGSAAAAGRRGAPHCSAG